MTYPFWKGEAKRLESIDISEMAWRLKCTEDHIHAVLEVETSGGGFDRYGRLKMLFEPHWFYCFVDPSKKSEAISQGLAYVNWGEQPYPKDSYPRFERAYALDPDAALKSSSWALGQIMGFNAEIVGFKSAREMVETFADDEDTHLEAMFNFIVAKGIDDDLREENWHGFAAVYNGPGYKKHGYHTKLAQAFKKWQKIPDTPFTPDMIDRTPCDPNPPEDARRETRGRPLRQGMRGADVAILQGLLNDLGYPCGEADGSFGRLTRDAVVSFQLDNDLQPDGVVGALTWEALDHAEPATERQKATVSDLRDKGSKTIRDMDAGQIAAGGGGVLAIISGWFNTGVEAAEKLDDLGILDRAILFVEQNELLLIAVMAIVAAWWLMGRTKRLRVDDHNSGAHRGR